MECNCPVCSTYRAREALLANARRSKRLALKRNEKPAGFYTEETVLPEKEQRRRDKRAYELRGGLTWNEFVAAVRTECNCTYAEAMQEASRRMRGAAPRSAADFEPARLERLTARANAVRVSAEKAIARQQAAKQRLIEQILAQLEQEQSIFESMPAAPPRLARDYRSAVFAPTPALSRTEATGCDLSDLPMPEPLRRTCATPTCDECCAHCRANERMPSFPAGGSGGGPESIPQIAFRELPPPPIGATVVRVPIDMAQMSALALNDLIAAAQRALANK